MKLFVIRHATAADRSPDGRDESRALTPEGRERFARAVAALRSLGVRFDLLLHSPLLRAVETAELCTPLLTGRTAVAAELAQAPSKSLLAQLRGESVAVVGHEPWQSELVAWLVTGERELGPRFAFRKGAVAALDGRAEPGAMALEFFASPRLLAAGDGE